MPEVVWQPTPHATPPQSRADSEWVGFAVAEGGQLEKANTDKATSHAIVTKCEQARIAARARAADKVKPWWKRIF